MKWPETSVETPQGPRTAVAPLVISASRATDIPAFHAEWFMNRLRSGYCLWTNPFNARQRQYVSFERSRVFVFWSKHPAALLPHLPEITERNYQFYFQYTLNDYEKTGLEPGLPQMRQRLDLFRRLSDQIGKHRVIWRFDPIILGGALTLENTLDRLYAIGREIAPYTEKLVFSFVDWYARTRRELGKPDSSLRPPSEEEMQRLARGIVEVERALQFIRNNTNLPIGVPDVIEHVRKSRSAFMLQFKNETGETIGKYIVKAKLQEAKQLLAYSDRSLAEISNFFYFSSQSYFQNLFKKHYGMTPLEYRKSHRKQ